ncbi:tetratricopeptide repeat protein [Catenulispora yoronensis]
MGSAYGGSGEVYRLLGRYDQAVADFDRALELWPSYPFGLGSRAQVHQALGRHDEAIADLRTATEIAPGIRWLQRVLGENLRAAGRLDEALEAFDQPIGDGTSASAQFRYERALTLLARGDTAAAAEAFADVAESYSALLADQGDAADPDHVWGLIKTRLAQGDAEGGRALVERLTALERNAAFGVAVRLDLRALRSSAPAVDSAIVSELADRFGSPEPGPG